MTRTIATNRRSRSAAVSLELLLALPLVLLLVLAVVQMGMMLAIDQRVNAASGQGARVAAQGGSLADIEAAVKGVLSESQAKAVKITAKLEDEYNQPLPSGAMVSVTVEIPARNVVPDLLGIIGFSIAGETFLAKTSMRKE